jgi:hypothetical protein
MRTAKGTKMTEQSKPVTPAEALEALDSLDDYAKMETSVDAYGPRELLRRFIEQNKQPPAEAGAAIAVVDADAPCGIALTDAGAKLPIGTKLYTSQTTATQAAVAVAKREAAREVYSFTGIQEATRNHLIERILSSVPAEANAALDAYVQEKCMEVANEMNTIKSIVDDDSIYSIVTSVIEKGK